MGEAILWLDPAERQFLSLTVSADEIWPPSEALLPLLRQVPGGDVAGGPQFRVTILALALRGGEKERPLSVSASEIWLLDSLLLRRDLRRDKLPDGRPLLELAEKVWALILDGYEEQLPPHLQSEVRDAEFDESPNKDSSAIIASAEAILRSEQGERTREDLPPTEA